jgi:hypothetical protein
MRPMKTQAEKSYDQIDSQKWKRIISAAAVYGIEINAHTGQGSAFGVMLRWSWAPASRRLAICILESTMLSDEAALKFIDGIIVEA